MFRIMILQDAQRVSLESKPKDQHLVKELQPSKIAKACYQQKLFIQENEYLWIILCAPLEDKNTPGKESATLNAKRLPVNKKNRMLVDAHSWMRQQVSLTFNFRVSSQLPK